MEIALFVAFCAGFALATAAFISIIVDSFKEE
jgi:hypothetical protein